MASINGHQRRAWVRPAALAAWSLALGASALADVTVLAAAGAATACGTSVVELTEARRRIGHTLEAIRGRHRDPFLFLGVAAVLAGVHAVVITQRWAAWRGAGPDVILLTSALLCAAGELGLLRERLRSHANELAREAAFVACIGGVTGWLAWVEGSWANRDIAAAQAVLELAAPAAACTAFILAGRLAAALGPAGRWFAIGPGALLLAGTFDVLGHTEMQGAWWVASSAASIVAAGAIGAGVAHRGLVGLRTTIAVPPSRVGAVRLGVVLAGVLLVPAVTIGRLLGDVEISVPSLVGTTAVLSIAAVAYLAGLARDWAQLERRAQRDELTGLPNRRYFTERLALAVADAAAHDTTPAVLFCDLDRFKVVNDSLGHASGNQLLIAVANRLAEAVPPSALAARLGGDEFAVLLADTNRAEAAAVAAAVRDELALPVPLQGRTLHIDTSIGVARFPDDGETPDALLRAADTAMYRAKDLGRSRVVLHSADLRTEMESRFAIEIDLRRALDRGQLHLLYQPRVDLGSGRIVGAEALLRWQHPTFGAISPSRFIPIAEETGLIKPIGNFVLHEVCRQLATWEQAGFPELFVSVNLSPRQFELDRMADSIARVLRETGADPTWLELELTESLAHHDIDDVSSTIADLADMGVRSSVDDFGTGYSGLSYLGRFRLHALKIDRAFVQAIGAELLPATTGGPTAVVSAVIALARSFDLRVIAEGVESHAQLRFMLEHGCDEMQGHLFSPPVDAESFESLAMLERVASGPGRLEVLKAAIVAEDRAHAAESNVIHLGGRRIGRPR